MCIVSKFLFRNFFRLFIANFPPHTYRIRMKSVHEGLAAWGQRDISSVKRAHKILLISHYEIKFTTFMLPYISLSFRIWQLKMKLNLNTHTHTHKAPSSFCSILYRIYLSFLLKEWISGKIYGPNETWIRTFSSIKKLKNKPNSNLIKAFTSKIACERSKPSIRTFIVFPYTFFREL